MPITDITGARILVFEHSQAFFRALANVASLRQAYYIGALNVLFVVSACNTAKKDMTVVANIALKS